MKKNNFIFFILVSLIAYTSCKNSELPDISIKTTPTPNNVSGTIQYGPLVVGYFPSWSESYPSGGNSPLRNVSSEVTHVFLAFVKPNMTYTKGSYDISGTGVQVPYDGPTLKETVSILKARGIKVILSIGGETYWNTPDAYNINYVQIADFVRDFGFQGIDWDFEPSGSFATIGNAENVQKFIDMINLSRAQLPRSEGYEIACAPAGCGALGGAVNDDVDSPYAYAKRATVTGDDISHTFDATNANGYSISLYGFASTGHMIPVLKQAGTSLDFIAFQGYNVGSASKREIMYDSYAYYANIYGFRVAFGMHVPNEPWGPYYTYDETKITDYTNYVAGGGKHNRKGKGDGIMIWELLLKSAINPAMNGEGYAKIAYPILDAANPVTTPSIIISSPADNAIIRQDTTGTTISVTTITKHTDKVMFYLDNVLISTVTASPWSCDIVDPSLGIHVIKVVAFNTQTNEQTETANSFKVVTKNSLEGIPVWNVTTVYSTPGTQVVYNNSVWSNKWYSVGETPGTSDVWAFVRSGPLTTGL